MRRRSGRPHRFRRLQPSEQCNGVVEPDRTALGEIEAAGILPDCLVLEVLEEGDDDVRVGPVVPVDVLVLPVSTQVRGLSPPIGAVSGDYSNDRAMSAREPGWESVVYRSPSTAPGPDRVATPL